MERVTRKTRRFQTECNKDEKKDSECCSETGNVRVRQQKASVTCKVELFNRQTTQLCLVTALLSRINIMSGGKQRQSRLICLLIDHTYRHVEFYLLETPIIKNRVKIENCFI